MRFCETPEKCVNIKYEKNIRSNPIYNLLSGIYLTPTYLYFRNYLISKIVCICLKILELAMAVMDSTAPT